ncbi:hypothetical protein [Lapillicoccus jejuensis]|uniref:hypothetical protein n=1 Tax=Lapillicoccus jejuensis TaxID=402171 RepID=UPI001151FFAD|nr:hypothetical protein [Lapillicoccus jejuensis]
MTLRASRRRLVDAGLGRTVQVPVYVRHSPLVVPPPPPAGLLLGLGVGGRIDLGSSLWPPDLGRPAEWWRAVHLAASTADAVETGDGWTRVLVGAVWGRGTRAALVLRDGDWALLREALALRLRPADTPQDAPAPGVLARFLGRLDGLEGTAARELWGRLALEVVGLRRPGHLAEARSLRWHACWGRGGFGAGSDGRATGYGDASTVLDLSQHQVRVEGRVFRVRTLPDWEREQAAHDLGMAPERLMGWPCVPLADLLGRFGDGSPAAPVPQDAVPAVPTPGPQDARGPDPRSSLDR